MYAGRVLVSHVEYAACAARCTKVIKILEGRIFYAHLSSFIRMYI